MHSISLIFLRCEASSSYQNNHRQTVRPEWGDQHKEEEITRKVYTATKENQIFLIYIRKFRMEQLHSHIWLTASSWEIFAHFLMYYEALPLQLLHSEFPYIWGKLDFLFYQCRINFHLSKFVEVWSTLDPPYTVHETDQIFIRNRVKVIHTFSKIAFYHVVHKYFFFIYNVLARRSYKLYFSIFWFWKYSEGL